MAEVEAVKKDEEKGNELSAAQIIQTHPKAITMAFIVWVVSYWTGFAIIPAIADNDLNRYQYWTWAMGMIGIISVYYALRAGVHADSKQGKPILAFATTAMSVDWSVHAYFALAGVSYWPNNTLMFCHGISLLWATLFFYKTNLTTGDRQMGWVTLFFEWLDLCMMCIAILVLDEELNGCLNNGMCIAYYYALTAHLILWFVPIMFGVSESSKKMHIHIIILDTLTDLPLIIAITSTQGYNVHWFIFIDVAYKLMMLLRGYGYHGFFHLVVAKPPTEDSVKTETETGVAAAQATA